MENVQGTAGAAPPTSSSLRRIDPFASLGVGWTAFTQRAGESIGFTLIVFVAGLVCGIPILGVLLSLLALPALYGGVYAFCLRQVRGEKPAFDVVFSGFGRWWVYVVSQLALSVIVFAAFTPTLIMIGMAGAWAVLTDASHVSSEHWAQFAAVIPIFCVNMLVVAWLGVRLGFNMPAIADDPSCGPLQALGRSWRATRGNTWRLIGFFIVLAFTSMAGVVALLIGLLVAVPVMLYAFSHAYTVLRENAGS